MAIFYTGLKNVSTIILAWLEWLSVECRKTKTKVITLAITKNTHNTVNQSKLEVITGS